MALGITIDASNQFNAIFLPIAQRIAHALQEIGVRVYNAPINNESKPRIIFGAHSNAKFWLVNNNENDIFVNFEPIFLEQWRQNHPHYISLLSNSRVLDYSKRSEPFTKNFDFLPIPPFHKTQIKKEKKNDALFIGSVNDRRKLILNKLQKTGVNLNVKFRIFGNEIFENIELSKLFIDVNFFEKDSIFNMFRFCMCAHTDTLYTAETSIIKGYPEVEKLAGLTISKNTEEFPELARKFLTNDKYREFALNIQHDVANQLEAKFQNFIQAFAEKYV